MKKKKSNFDKLINKLNKNKYIINISVFFVSIISKIIDVSYKFTNKINTNKLLMGFSILLLNIISKHVQINLTELQQESIKKLFSKDILIFFIIFVATKDIILALILTCIFYIFSNYLLNEKSKHCIVNKHFNNINLKSDRIDKEEVDRAINILIKAKNNLK